MGRIANDEADLPQSRRRVAFTAPEVKRLVQELKLRKDIIYGTKDQPPQPRMVRLAWEEIAEIVSSQSNIERSAEQCRKRFNDIKRRGQKMVAGRKRGRPPKNRQQEDDSSDHSDMEYKKHAEPEDLEFEVQAPMDDDPDYEPSPKKRDSIKITVHKEVPKSAHFDPPATASHSPSPKPPAPSLPKHQTLLLSKPQSPSLSKPQSPSLPKPQTPSLPKPQSPSLSKPQSPLLPKPQAPSLSKPQVPSLPKAKVVLVRKAVGTTDPAVRQKQQEDEKHPFLELQQAGFDMLKRELSGFRDSVMSLNTRLNHLEVALRPIGQIADSLARVATAVERLTCPPE